MIDIRPITEADIESFANALQAIIEERQYLAATQAPPLKQIINFVQSNIEKGYPQLIASKDNAVIGWCDAIAQIPAERAHVAKLGMGVLAEFRGKGIGRKLINQCLELSIAFGFEKIELDVYSDNFKAISLYKTIGFQIEGTRENSRKLDGQYQDIALMGKFLPTSEQSQSNVSTLP